MPVRYWQSPIVGIITGAFFLYGGQPHAVATVATPETGAAFHAATPAAEVYETIIAGSDLKNIFVTMDQTGGQPVIGFALNGAGAARMYAFTSTHIGQPLAIVIDQQVISTPIIQAATSNEGIISGSFTPDEARDLVRTVKQGVTTFEIIDPRGSYLSPGTPVITTGTTSAPRATPAATPVSRGGR